MIIKSEKILKTNFPQKQEKQIEKDHNCSTRKKKERKSQNLGKKKSKRNVFCVFLLRKLKKLLRSPKALLNLKDQKEAQGVLIPYKL